MPIIEVEHVTKEYRLGAMESLKSIGIRMFARNRLDSSNFKALDDVSFSVEKGEVVGFIGHNGAGKSTLLKLLSGIVTQTSGRITVKGKIAPLIEVGAGLVGDMTGRENIYLNASILGMSRADIGHKVDEIIAFSELEQFIDTPVKRYSSGMQVRLGYAIATAVEPEILIVDEVLAVGDLNFQRKSMARIQKLIQNRDITVLIVGHNVRQLERICTRMILMDHGRILMDGTAKVVSNRYFDLASEVELKKIKEKKQEDWSVESSGELVVDAIYMTNADDSIADEFIVGESFKIVIELTSKVDVRQVDIGIAIQTPDLLCVGVAKHTGSFDLQADLSKGKNRFVCRLSNMNLLPGLFALRVGIRDSEWQIMWAGENLFGFRIKAPSHANATRYSEITFIEFDTHWSHSTSE